MTELQFNQQVERLEDQWRMAYGHERKAILWRVFGKTEAGEFQEAVSDCLATMRNYPLVKELSEAINGVKVRAAEGRAYDETRVADIAGFLGAAAERTANFEFAKACVDTLEKKLHGELTPSQWQEACGLLEETAKQLEGKACMRCERGWALVEKNGYRSLYRCRCSAGRALPSEIVGGINKSGERVVREIPIMEAL